MEFAVHIKHKETGEKRIRKVTASDTWEATHKANVGYGTPWIWTGTEPFHHVADKAIRLGGGYYKLPPAK